MAQFLNPCNEEQVHTFFNAIAKIYDLINLAVSFGTHTYWRKVLILKANSPPGSLVLDLCCGTGKITKDLAKMVGPHGKVVGLDFSENMLAIAKKNLKDYVEKNTVTFIQADAQNLPFASNTFDCITIGYGLRNVKDLQKVLLEMKRVAKPGACVVSLELAKPYLPGFKQIYHLYLTQWIPLIGKMIAKNPEAYQYLRNSVLAYPHQHDITEIFKTLGFQNPECYELTWGVAAIHRATKPI